MALEGINTAQYNAFVSFARANLAERGGKSVARLAEGGAARAISAADPGRDGVHKFWRDGDEKTRNERPSFDSNTFMQVQCDVTFAPPRV